MSFPDVIDVIWRCAGILFLIVETAFFSFCCIGVPIVWKTLDKIDGALRCIDIDLAAFLRDERKKWRDKE